MKRLSLSGIDAGIIAFYLLLTFYLGFTRRNGRTATTARSRTQDTADYLVAGRRLTLPAFIATLVSTWYGGILGVGEFTYRFGISNWLVFGVPYYLYALIFALFLARPARRGAHFTIPDRLESVYGRPASIAGAVFIFMLTLPAPYLLMLGTLLILFFELPLWIAVILCALYSMLYIARNGLPAVIRTDILQFALMFAGFFIVIGFAATRFGGADFLIAHLPAAHLTWHGGNSLQYILVWYVIAASTLVDPNFYQRCFAARSEGTARAGILVSIILWIGFDFLTTTAGLYARALLPNLANPVESFPRLAAFLLPPVAKGLFLVALLATIMSTLDSFAFVASVTLGRDVLWRLRGSREQDPQQAFVRWGLLATFALSIALALYTPSVIDIWYQLGSVATPALAIPLAASFTRTHPLRPRTALASIVLSGSLSLLWLLLSRKSGTTLLGVEPIYPGLLLSLCLWLWDRSRRSAANQTAGIRLMAREK